MVTGLWVYQVYHVLWQDKKVVQLSTDDNMHMEGFALQVFAKADKQDRAGRADLYVSTRHPFVHAESVWTLRFLFI